MGWVDRDNRYRQGILGLHGIWKTKRWQTRIQLELLGVTLVDSFLASLQLLPKWRLEKDGEQEGWRTKRMIKPQGMSEAGKTLWILLIDACKLDWEKNHVRD